ncbi:MAG: hypothetical protein RMJ67_07765 [Elusimicrobiota bacterium]|nr:hypothetical protein [Endomicrobiia bacterium]MDW8166389.1 hypothetical protein [Elusimicrobiota bacterium]
MSIKIEKNVPITKRIYQKRNAYPFRSLEIGDSFTVPLEEEKRIRTLASVWGKKLKKRFIVSREEEEVRVWRVE